MFKGLKFVWKNSRVWLLVTSISMVVILTITLLATQVGFFKNTIITVLGDYRQTIGNPDSEGNYLPDEGIKTKKDSLAYANDVNLRINQEGIVLLKNDNSLPIKTPVSSSSVTSSPKISVFGKNSVNMVYGGSGSGAMNIKDRATLYSGLTKAGFDVNPTLKKFYESSASGSGRPEVPTMGSEIKGFATGETPLSSYTAEVKSSYSSYDDAALVVISRIGGEGFDLPVTMKNTTGANADDHYLQLDNNERALLKDVAAKFSNVIVVINSGSVMELGFLDDPNHYAYHENIKGALWVGFSGGSGADAIGEVLSGKINPSGRLVDTYVRNHKNDPTWQNFGTNLSDNGHKYTTDGVYQDAYFVEYEESIYVGYRYYETKYADLSADTRDKWYTDSVVYPFGYGLSYTSFETKIISSDISGAKNSDGEVSVTVEVKNTGTVAGKEVVQLYNTSPYYTDGIEKSEVALVGYEKTDVLYPSSEATGDKKNSQQLTFNVKVQDLASYDYNDKNDNGFKGYELEAGQYILSVRQNAHKLCGNDTSVKFSIDDTSTTQEGITNSAANGANGYAYPTDGATGNSVENRFDDVSSYIENYLSRSNFDGTATSRPTAADQEVTREFIDSLSVSAYIGSGRNVDRDKPWANNTEVKYEKKEVSKKDIRQLVSLQGKDYDDELWNELLDKLTLQQMVDLIGLGNFKTSAINNITKPQTTDPDGPAGFTNFMAIGDAATVYETCQFASECVIAATFNKELLAEMGNAIGNEALIGNKRSDGRPYSGWYAPAVNIHRNAFAGRNFEYYSEDSYLSGAMGAELVKSVSKKGVYTYVKHFALNDQETQRGGICTWASEQAMREIYFKPFEIIVKEGKTTAMMSSFNRIGTVWTGGSYELLTEVLRDEWGFRGMVITDYNTYNHMDADQMIRAGGDLNLFQGKYPSISGGLVNKTHINALRNATKNILYTVVNSNAMNDVGVDSYLVTRLPVWMEIAIAVNVVAVIAFAVWGFFDIFFKRKRLKKEAVVVEEQSEQS